MVSSEEHLHGMSNPVAALEQGWRGGGGGGREGAGACISIMKRISELRMNGKEMYKSYMHKKAVDIFIYINCKQQQQQIYFMRRTNNNNNKTINIKQ